METDGDCMFPFLFAKEAADVMFVIINFISKRTTAQRVPLNFTLSLPGGGGFYWQEDVNEELWMEEWISRGINVILPLWGYMMDILYILIHI